MEGGSPSPSVSSSSAAVSHSDEVHLTSSDTSLSSLGHDGDANDGEGRKLKAAQHGKASKCSRTFGEGSQQQVAVSGSPKAIRSLINAPNPALATSQLKNSSRRKQDVGYAKASKTEIPGKHVRFHLSETPSFSTASPSFKQVRFSDRVEERSIPGNRQFDGSDDGSDSSNSSHSSRDWNIDEGAHMLLQDAAEPEAGLLDRHGTEQASPLRRDAAGSIPPKFDRSPCTETGLIFQDHSFSTYKEAPLWIKSLGQHDTMGGDRSISARNEDCAPFESHFEDSFEIEDLPQSRFESQKMLSPLSRYAFS